MVLVALLMVGYLPFLLLYLLVGEVVVHEVMVAVLAVTAVQAVVVVGIMEDHKLEEPEIHQAHLLMAVMALLRLRIKGLMVVMVMKLGLLVAVVGEVAHLPLEALVAQAQAQMVVLGKLLQLLALQ